jgi:SynChlorMet cassette protein ScmD
VPKSDKPVANALVVLREEFDDWAVLFDPDTGSGFGINPIGVAIWKLLDGQHSVEDILKELHDRCENVPDEAEQHVRDFIQSLVGRGLAGYALQRASAP